MPDFSLSQQPRFPLMTIDTEVPITEEQLQGGFEENQGVTLCVRTAQGHPQRGGHFFCLAKNGNQSFNLETVEGVYVDTFSSTDLIRFINHAAGLQFDEGMLLYCQNSVNFRSD